MKKTICKLAAMILAMCFLTGTASVNGNEIGKEWEEYTSEIVSAGLQHDETFWELGTSIPSDDDTITYPYIEETLTAVEEQDNRNTIQAEPEKDAEVIIEEPITSSSTEQTISKDGAGADSPLTDDMVPMDETMAQEEYIDDQTPKIEDQTGIDESQEPESATQAELIDSNDPKELEETENTDLKTADPSDIKGNEEAESEEETPVESDILEAAELELQENYGNVILRDEGDEGDTIVVEVTDQGVLLLSGQGTMNLRFLQKMFDDLKITKVVIQEGITGIMNFAFYECTGIKELVLADSIEGIGYYTFQGCTSLKSLKLPKNLKGIGMSAFQDCSSLTTITFPDQMVTIEPYAFANCSSLKTVRIPYITYYFGNNIFDSCTSLTSVVVDDRNSFIRTGSFKNCSSLTEITLPENLTEIEYDAFNGCKSLKKINYKGSKGTWDKLMISSGNDALKTAAIYYSIETVPVTTSNITFSLTYGQTEARNMLSLVNSFRTSNEAWYWNEDNKTKTWCTGLGKLTYDYDLEKIAMQRAAELVVSFDHYRPDGSYYSSAYSEFGYNGSVLRENIFKGSLSDCNKAEYVFKKFREDSSGYSGQGHRRNFLNQNVNRIGVGHVIVNGTHYWAVELAYSNSGFTYTRAAETEKNVSINLGNPASYYNDANIIGYISGFTKVNGKWGWYSNGRLQINTTGIVYGIINNQAGWYYIKNGKFTKATRAAQMADGSDNKWYYVENGRLKTGWVKYKNKYYYCSPSTGEIRTGWIKSGGKYYYLDPSTGALKTGWLIYEGNYYYLSPKTGNPVTGTATIGGKTYTFNANGVCVG